MLEASTHVCILYFCGICVWDLLNLNNSLPVYDVQRSNFIIITHKRLSFPNRGKGSAKHNGSTKVSKIVSKHLEFSSTLANIINWMVFGPWRNWVEKWDYIFQLQCFYSHHTHRCFFATRQYPSTSLHLVGKHQNVWHRDGVLVVLSVVVGFLDSKEWRCLHLDFLALMWFIDTGVIPSRPHQTQHETWDLILP